MNESRVKTRLTLRRMAAVGLAAAALVFSFFAFSCGEVNVDAEIYKIGQEITIEKEVADESVICGKFADASKFTSKYTTMIMTQENVGEGSVSVKAKIDASDNKNPKGMIEYTNTLSSKNIGEAYYVRDGFLFGEHEGEFNKTNFKIVLKDLHDIWDNLRFLPDYEGFCEAVTTAKRDISNGILKGAKCQIGFDRSNCFVIDIDTTLGTERGVLRCVFDGSGRPVYFYMEGGITIIEYKFGYDEITSMNMPAPVNYDEYVTVGSFDELGR